jgi:hypothetical protein
LDGKVPLKPGSCVTRERSGAASTTPLELKSRESDMVNKNNLGMAMITYTKIN